ncbi:ROK family glucokinase [Angustibacter sp. Root456]|uniref:ROK family glucokinase n=1 Tax=Angustibacter sp. Root456 TaxID=1736539 RepID=UPI0007002197|nr:ROK family glucokinase [Angustibacter sp. Root456]KQX64433.1 glucokinase [Angustibacter sp. Root456]
MGLTIGVDIGGTKIAAGVVDEKGTLLATTRRETQASDPDAIEREVTDAVAELRRDHDVEAVGVAAAGFVDAHRGIVLFAPNLAWREEPLRDELAARIDLPVVVENDANAAAWGEFTFGTARDVDDAVLVTVGTGLGGGIVVDGRLLRGHVGVGGELGHLRVVPDGIRCGCGNRGCWEQYASGSALEREGRDLVASGSVYAARLIELCDGDPARLRGQMITAAAAEGDAAAVELLADLGRWLGEGMASVAAVLDPALFVVGGGVVEAGDLLIEPARAALGRQLTGRSHRPPIEVEAATLGNAAGMIGAADLARTRS